MLNNAEKCRGLLFAGRIMMDLMVGWKEGGVL